MHTHSVVNMRRWVCYILHCVIWMFPSHSFISSHIVAIGADKKVIIIIIQWKRIETAFYKMCRRARARTFAMYDYVIPATQMQCFDDNDKFIPFLLHYTDYYWTYSFACLFSWSFQRYWCMAFFKLHWNNV